MAESCSHASNGMSTVRFSIHSPDLVICAGSPDIPTPGKSYGDSPELFGKDNKSCIELSFENGFDGTDAHKTTSVKFSTVCQTYDRETPPDSSLELVPLPTTEGNSLKNHLPVISINAGCTDGAVDFTGVSFLEDHSYVGGDVMITGAVVGDGEGISLYNTARIGDFSYKFLSLDVGEYTVDLHFAEIFFTNGPPGVRLFDVFVQEQKVVSCLDIYGQVGANRPLVIPEIKSSVRGNEGLCIRFEGVKGCPIVCGISVKKANSVNSEPAELPNVTEMTAQDIGDYEDEEKYQELQKVYRSQKKELMEMKRALEELKTDNQLKSNECQEAWRSLQDLQNELMRKSMHVGSLAFAIEGQVKEKSRWFSSLRDMTRKFKIMKIEHMKLSEEALTYKTCCLEDFNKISDKILSRIKHQVDLHEDLKIKFIKGDKGCKELYNKVLELKGNIRVFCRCRPLHSEEITSGASMAIDFDSANEGELTVISQRAPKKTFKFDAVFGPQSPQAEVFEGTAPFATSVLDGYNVCIFAYGQTGTGKTFTMEGTEEARGVNFRTLDELFNIIRERQKIYRYDISVSVLEVYNEQIRDLLAPGSQPGVVTKRLEVRQVSEGIHHVPGLVEAHVDNMNEVWEVLQIGSNARAVGSTNANEHSSRSHCIHCVMVKGENLLTGERTKSKLWLVDLAGSERVAKTEVQGERLREAQNINRSLSALGDVISALASKSPHIPFRNSKLTHLLQDSLGGDSKMMMFVQISPNENDLVETLCSLNFASRVRGIELGPSKKQFDNTELLKFKQMAEKLKNDMKIKDMQMKMMEDTVHGLDLKMKDKDLKNKNLQDKVKELESQLLIERKLARQHIDTKIAEQHHMEQQQEELHATSVRPPLATRPLGTNKNLNEVASIGALMKEHVNLTHPLSENSCRAPAVIPSTNGAVKYIDADEKENNPKLAEPLLEPQKRTGRASICTTNPGLPVASAPRRNSMIPLRGVLSSPQLPTPCQVNIKEEEDDIFPEQGLCDRSPKGMKNAGKKMSNTARRSIQKKIPIRSPLPKHLRRGLNVGMERVRVSIGSRGRMAHRRTAMKEGLQKKKERAWNAGTLGRTPI